MLLVTLPHSLRDCEALYRVAKQRAADCPPGTRGARFAKRLVKALRKQRRKLNEGLGRQ